MLVPVTAGDFFGVEDLPGLLTSHSFQLALIAPVMLYAGWPIYRRTGWLALRNRGAEMNTLITVGTSAAFLYSVVVTVAPGLLPEDVRDVYFEVVGVILTLILLGRLLDARARAGTGEAIRRLLGTCLLPSPTTPPGSRLRPEFSQSRATCRADQPRRARRKWAWLLNACQRQQGQQQGPPRSESLVARS